MTLFVLILGGGTIFAILDQRSYTDATSNAVAILRTINTAEVEYLSSSGGNYGTVSDLIRAGLIDSRFFGPVSGYSFEVTVSGAGIKYRATATPTSANAGRYAYYSIEDAVVRYAANLAPPGKADSPVK